MWGHHSNFRRMKAWNRWNQKNIQIIGRDGRNAPKHAMNIDLPFSLYKTQTLQNIALCKKAIRAQRICTNPEIPPILYRLSRHKLFNIITKLNTCQPWAVYECVLVNSCDGGGDHYLRDHSAAVKCLISNLFQPFAKLYIPQLSATLECPLFNRFDGWGDHYVTEWFAPEKCVLLKGF